MKDIVFISHATPEDSYQAAWLSSKLRLLGYKVWIDLEDLSAGDSFNNVISPKIKQSACLFIPITTIAYSAKAANQNTGVSRELNCAASVDVKALGHNFFFPTRFDDIDYSDFPYHYLGWNAISFTGNWQKGLVETQKHLERLEIPRSIPSNPLSLWLEVGRGEKTVIDKREKYYSNWFEIALPSKLHAHITDSVKKSDLYSFPYPYILHSNLILSFSERKQLEKFAKIRETKECDIKDFLDDRAISIEPTITIERPKDLLTYLLNNAFENHLYKKELIGWKRGKKKHFYFRSHLSSKMIGLGRYGKPRGRRALTGTTTEYIDGLVAKVNWAFSIVARAQLEPFPHYEISYSLVFSDSTFRRYDSAIHHRLRRGFASDWFNRKWFETLLSAMLTLSPDTRAKAIEIAIDDDLTMRVDNEPTLHLSDKGYIEPDGK